MSVQSEIDRIAGAKSDISTAITNKGVTVPPGTKLDGMAALIGSIASGGSTLELETGKITSTKIESSPFMYNYAFDLSTITNLNSRVMVALIDTTSSIGLQGVVAILVKNGGKYSIFAGGAFSSLMNIDFHLNESIIQADEASLYYDTAENPTYYAI